MYKKIESIEDLADIICTIENGDILLKVQDSKLVYAEYTKKFKPNLDLKSIKGLILKCLKK